MKIVLGTRGSALATAQSGLIADWIRGRSHDVEVREFKTTGDRVSELNQPIEGKGIFTKELDEALLDGRIDVAVHSLKDLPSDLAPGLRLTAVPPREDPRDVLVSRGGLSLRRLPAGARVGTGSPRRAGQLLAVRPDIQCIEARGNVDTRIRRLREGKWDAIALARAGLVRLGRLSEATETLEFSDMIPAVGQGALAVVTRDDRTASVFAPLDDADSRAAILCERRILRDLQGGCRAPIAAHAFREGGELRVLAAVFSVDGSDFLREERRGSDPEALGRETADALLAHGAAAIVAAARAAS
ncbi:MAG: hydroxymethylbilane synthase [Thermoanaerobaculia bacterium]